MPDKAVKSRHDDSGGKTTAHHSATTVFLEKTPSISRRESQGLHDVRRSSDVFIEGDLGERECKRG